MTSSNVHPINASIMFARLSDEDAIAISNRFASGLVFDPPEHGRKVIELLAREMANDLRIRGIADDDNRLDEDLIHIRDWQ